MTCFDRLTGIGRAFIFTVALIIAFVCVHAQAEERGFMGMQVQGVSPRIAAAIGFESSAGVLIRDISIDGPASNAGLRRGDLIVTMQGKKIDTFERLLQLSATWKSGETIDVEVWRSGKTTKLSMTLASWPETWLVKDNAFAAQPDLGLTFAALTPKLRERLGIRWGSTGLIVTVSDDQFAGVTPLRRGDLVVQINQKPVWHPKQFLEAYSKAKDAGAAHLLMLVERTDGYRYMVQPVASGQMAPAPGFKLPGQGG